MSSMKGRKEILQVMMRDGSMEVDNGAIKVGAQLVSSILSGAALPVRPPTPSYVHKEVNRAPTKRSGVHFETVDPIPPDFDSQFVLRDAFDIWNAARLDLDREANDGKKMANFFQAVAVIVSSFLLIASLGMVFTVNHAEEQTAAEAARTEQSAAAQPPAPPSLPQLPPSWENGN